MPNKVLVAYATRAGSTQLIAESISKILTESGFSADARSVKELRSIDGYDAVILGTAIRIGMPMSEMNRFVRKNCTELAKIPVAAFAVCLAVTEDTPENRKTIPEYLAPIRKELSLVSEVVLAGAINYARLGFFARLITQKMIKAPEGDFRDKEKIKEWTQEVIRCFRSTAKGSGGDNG